MKKVFKFEQRFPSVLVQYYEIFAGSISIGARWTWVPGVIYRIYRTG